MKKNLFVAVILALIIGFCITGCAEHHYYRTNHHHSERYYHMHHRTPPPGINFNMDYNIHR